MFKMVFTSQRKVTLGLLTAWGTLGLGAIILGISDNPPGIVLAYLSAIALVLAWVHTWRKTKKFLLFSLASVIGLIALVIISIQLNSFSQKPALNIGLRSVFKTVSDLMGLVVYIVFPPAFLTGLTGAFVMYIKKLRHAHKPKL